MVRAARAAKAMAMVTKRVIARKRAMASNNDNKTTMTETTTMTIITMATNTMMTTTMLMMTTRKMTTKQGRAMKAVAVGVECSYFFIKLNSGCCWFLTRGRGGRREA